MIFLTTIYFFFKLIIHSFKNLFKISSSDQQIRIACKWYITKCNGNIMQVINEYKKQYWTKIGVYFDFTCEVISDIH